MCGVQQSVCVCVSFCCLAQVCARVLQCFHASGESSRKGAEPVVHRHLSGQEVHLQRGEERLCEAAGRERERGRAVKLNVEKSNCFYFSNTQTHLSS